MDENLTETECTHRGVDQEAPPCLVGGGMGLDKVNGQNVYKEENCPVYSSCLVFVSNTGAREA